MTLDLDTHQLIAFLGRGGKWQNYWTAPGKRSIWFPTGKPVDPPQVGENIYFSVNPTREIPKTNALGEIKPPKFVRSRIDHIAAINALFGEFDQDQGATLEQIEAIYPRPSVVIESGGGWHAYWLLDAPFLLDTPEAVKRVKVAQYGWVDYIKSDPGAKDLARVLRVPGTHNLKYDPPRPVRFCWAEFGRVYRLSELEPFISLQAEFKPAASHPHIERPISEKIDFWLNKALEKAKPGNRNATGFELACQLRDEGLAEPEIISVPYPEYVPQPTGKAYTRAEWSATVRSVLSQPAREPAVGDGNQAIKVYDPEPPEAFDPDFFRRMEVEGIMVEQPPNGTPRTSWTDAEILASEFPPPNWAIEGLIPEGLTILGGRPKVGKSWLALQLALSVKTGGRFLNVNVSPGAVLYLALEDNGRRLQERMRLIGWQPGGEPVHFETQIPPLHKPEGLNQLLLWLEREKYKLLVIDTIERATSGADKNDEKIMGPVYDALQRMAIQRQMAVIVVDHLRKPGGITSDPVDDVIGSTAKTGVSDAVIALYREQGKPGAIIKGRGRDIDEIDFQLSFDPFTHTWQVEGSASEIAIREKWREVLDALGVLGKAQVGEIASAIGGNRGNTYRTLVELVNAGMVIRESVGRSVFYEKYET